LTCGIWGIRNGIGRNILRLVGSRETLSCCEINLQGFYFVVCGFRV
jgi:hypothetical protein